MRRRLALRVAGGHRPGGGRFHHPPGPAGEKPGGRSGAVTRRAGRAGDRRRPRRRPDRWHTGDTIPRLRRPGGFRRCGRILRRSSPTRPRSVQVRRSPPGWHRRAWRRLHRRDRRRRRDPRPRVNLRCADGRDRGATVVVRTEVSDQELSQGVRVAWMMLAGLGVFLVVSPRSPPIGWPGAIVQPVSALSEAARSLGSGDLETQGRARRPPGDRRGRGGLQLPRPPTSVAPQRRARVGRRSVAPAAHPARRRCGCRPRRSGQHRVGGAVADIDRLDRAMNA